MKRGKSHRFFFLYAFTFLILLASLIGLYYYCLSESSRLHTYIFAGDSIEQSQDGLSIQFSVSKQWDDEQLHSDIPVGAQYDGVLKNNSLHVFKRWSLKMIYSDNMFIDSSWNGNYATNGSQIDFEAVGVPATVEPGGSFKFGMVMYAKDIETVQSCMLKGYLTYHMSEMPLFYVIIVLFVVWLLGLSVHITTTIRTKTFQKRHELDAQIITQTMSTLTGFIDAKDTYTRGHSARVAEYSVEIARRMKLTEDQITQLRYIALMHDCGKIAVPDALLKKPGKLSNEEYEKIKAHTVIGDKLLEDFTAIPGIRDGAHFHHERFDGNGYPNGLSGDNIPLCARIICVADSFDAMNSNRCYRKHLEKDQIIEELSSNAGKQFDPQIVPYMIALFEDGFVDEVKKRFPISVEM